MHFSIGVVLCLVRVRLGKEMLEVELGSQLSKARALYYS